MNIGTTIVYFGALLLAAQVVPAASPAFTRSDFADINAFLQKNFVNTNAGMVIGLVDEHGGKILSAGKLDNGTDQDVNGDTIFEIGSCTKTFTALLAIEMAGRGEIDLEAPVAKYLPKSMKMPTRGGREITILNLAAQDSGLPFNADNLSGKDWKERFDNYTVHQMYAFLSGHTLTTEPGSKFQYSNLGMSLLGHVMELNAGTNFEALVVNRICAPLQMRSTCMTLTPELKARAAAGHDANGKWTPYYDLKVMAGAGALRSTANDLLKYVSANLGLTRSHLTPLMERMQVIRRRDSPEFGQTAMPWMDFGVYQPPGMELLGHGGGTDGCSAFIGFDKRQRRGVVVLSNQKAGIANTYPIGLRILQGAPLKGIEIAKVMAIREYVGSGIAFDLDQQTGTLRVGKVFPNSPASRARLSPGLVIQKINGVPTAGKNLAECAALGRGDAGTMVRMELIDLARKETNIVELTKRKFLTN